MPWFDAGVNLTDARLEPAAVLDEAAHAGVMRMCIITTAPSEWDSAIALCQRFPGQLFCTIGIHPHNARLATDADFDRLVSLLPSPGVVAVGECGLDFNRNFSPPDVQETVFRRQLAIAVASGKPVYLHERDALPTQLCCLDAVKGNLRGGIAHCFTQGESALESYLEHGLYIGVTGWFCDPKRGEALRNCVNRIPDDKLILETDAPYLFPKTLKPRQRNNSPAYLPHIGRELANHLQRSEDEISQLSYGNTCRLFGLSEA